MVSVGLGAFLAQLGCEFIDREGWAYTDGEGVFDDIAQFSDISRPRVLKHGLEYFFIDTVDGSLARLVEFVDEVPCECFDIAFAFDEAWQVERNDAYAVHEIFTKASRFDESAEGLVGCGEHAYVDAHGVCAAEGNECPLLEYAQESCLNIERKLRDFVQEDGAVIGEGEEAFAIFDRASECAAHVSKKFGCEQFWGERRAVNGLEGAVCAVR